MSFRVLALHSRYVAESSGENHVVEQEARLLERGGHRSFLLQASVAGPGAIFRAAAGVIWDLGRTSELRRLIRRLRPDVVHVHNLFPALSPAVIRAAVRRGVPVVMTLHNFRLLCLPATLLRDGRICRDCVGRPPWRGILHGCYRGSRVQSVPMAISLGLHRGIGTFGRVTRFIAVSDFVRRVHVQAGLPEDRVVVKPNFAWPAPRRQGPGGSFLYLGRLSAEKGVEILLRAWRPDLGRLVIAGDGPEAARLRALAGEGVEFLGTVAPARARDLVAEARALLVPSVCYEGFPRVVVEAYACGVPVVASRIGSLAEVVEGGVTGLLAEPGEPASWAEAVSRLREDELSLYLGEGAYRAWAERYTPERNLEILETIYRGALAAAGGA